MSNKWKIWICNMVMAALAIASIVTLCLGSFFKIIISVKVDGEKMDEIMEENGAKGESGESGESGEASDILGDFSFKDSDLNIDLNLSFDIKGSDALKSFSGDTKNVSDLVKREAGAVVDSLMGQVKGIFKAVAGSAAVMLVDKAQEELVNQIKEDLAKEGKTVTDEEISEKLESEYGITESDIGSLKTDIKEAIVGLIDGEDADTVKTLLQNNATLDKILAEAAKEELQGEEGGEAPTQDQINAKKQQMKDEVISKYDESIKEFEDENGKISAESVIFGVVNKATGGDDAKEEEESSEGSGKRKIENEEDLKEYIEEVMGEALTEETLQAINYVFMFFGGFILLVCLTWAYLLIKVLVRFFTKKKTVSMFAPRFFGWMPHVFFVGLPMTFIKLLNSASVQEKIASSAEEAGKVITYLSMVDVKITSLAWVSAAATVVLMIISFFYRKWRKGEKNGEINE